MSDLVERVLPSLRKGPVVTETAVPGEDVVQVPRHGSCGPGKGQVPQFALLHILLDRIQGELSVDFKLGLTESWNLYHHVQGLGVTSSGRSRNSRNKSRMSKSITHLIGGILRIVERNIVPGGHQVLATFSLGMRSMIIRSLDGTFG